MTNAVFPSNENCSANDMWAPYSSECDVDFSRSPTMHPRVRFGKRFRRNSAVPSLDRTVRFAPHPLGRLRQAMSICHNVSISFFSIPGFSRTPCVTIGGCVQRTTPHLQTDTEPARLEAPIHGNMSTFPWSILMVGFFERSKPESERFSASVAPPMRRWPY